MKHLKVTTLIFLLTASTNLVLAKHSSELTSTYYRQPELPERTLVAQALVGLTLTDQACRPRPADWGYFKWLESVIVSSVPLEEGDRYAAKVRFSTVSFEVEKDGKITNRHFSELSGSLARDFWTVYAVASCPPLIPPKEVKTPYKTSIIVFRSPMIDSKQAIDLRRSLAAVITRNANANELYFPLIPASFVQTFPSAIDAATITNRKNLVGISIKRLCLPGKKYWTLESANRLLKEDSQVSTFLDEWPIFLGTHPNPSTQQILHYADLLKRKYNSLLKTEGEPEAPLP